ncbi:MAG TPA: hypothetical protein VES66_05895 [Terriglobales bacterium]|nr:hypothetical protein [Terriglobales bacterium]
MRNALLITAALFCLATSALAADEKQNAQPQSKQTEQTQMARNDADGSMDHASSAKSDCMPKAGKQSQPKNRQDNSEGDPQASQNQVEYGGAG